MAQQTRTAVVAQSVPSALGTKGPASRVRQSNVVAELGYQLGYSDGYAAGYATGYATGYAAGYTAGQAAGYSAGYTAGQAAGYSAGYTAGQAAGYASGFAAGQSAGYSSGYAAGFTAGEGTAPTIANLTPTAGATPGSPGAFSLDYSTARNTPIQFDVTGVPPGTTAVVIFVKFSNRDEMDVALDANGTWQWPFDVSSSIGSLSSLPAHVVLMPRDGWPPVHVDIQVAAARAAVGP